MQESQEKKITQDNKLEKPKSSKKSTNFVQKTGRRKTSVARVRLTEGTGKIIVNEKPVENYFSDIESAKSRILKPLALVGLDKKKDIQVRVVGGGKNAQVDAIIMGVARSIIAQDNSLKTTLKKADFLTRDARMKERKKYGLKRARKAPQYRKR